LAETRRRSIANHAGPMPDKQCDGDLVRRAQGEHVNYWLTCSVGPAPGVGLAVAPASVPAVWVLTERGIAGRDARATVRGPDLHSLPWGK